MDKGADDFCACRAVSASAFSCFAAGGAFFVVGDCGWRAGAQALFGKLAVVDGLYLQIMRRFWRVRPELWWRAKDAVKLDTYPSLLLDVLEEQLRKASVG